MFCPENPWGRSATKKAQGFGRTVEHENDVTADYGLLSLPSAVLLLPHDAAEDKSWLTANERQNPKKCVACVKRRFMQNEHFSVKLAALHASELAFSTSESSSCPCNFLLPACVFHDIMRFLAWLRLILAHDVRAIVCCFWGLPEEIAKRPTPHPLMLPGDQYLHRMLLDGGSVCALGLVSVRELLCHSAHSSQM